MQNGEVFIPRWKSFKVGDLARVIAPECKQVIIGARKHEKMHECFFANVEINRLLENRDYFIITKDRMSENNALDFYQSLNVKEVEDYCSDANEFMQLADIEPIIEDLSLINRRAL